MGMPLRQQGPMSASISGANDDSITGLLPGFAVLQVAAVRPPRGRAHGAQSASMTASGKFPRSSALSQSRHVWCCLRSIYLVVRLVR